MEDVFNLLKNDDFLFSEFPPVSTEEWEKVIKEDLKGADYSKKLIWQTAEGFQVKPYFRSEDLAGLDFIETNPGNFPFVRGYSNEGKNDWEICQYIEAKNISEANTQALEAISRGANSVSFDVKDIATYEELNILLNGINLEQVSVNFHASLSFSILINLLLEYIKKQGFNKTNIKGAMFFDSYAYFLKHGEYYNSLSDNISELACLIELAKNELPGYRIICPSGNIFHNAGANCVQELAFTLSLAHEYMVNLLEKGFSIDEITPRLQLNFAIGSNYFMEIAKIRAARLLWSNIVSKYNPTSDNSYKTHIHGITSQRNKSVYDPYVNMLRTTTEALSGIIGGLNSVTVIPFDSIYKPSDEFSQRISRNQQIILKEESHLDKITDPAAGSYYIENLTQSLAVHAANLFQQIEQMGGFAKALESGFVKTEIEKAAEKRWQDIQSRKATVLGVNQYPNSQEKMLSAIEKPLVDESSTYLKQRRDSEVFEQIRLSTEKFAQKTGKTPKVFLLTMGNLAMRRARAGFAQNFFGCAGFEIIDNNGFSTVEEGMEAAVNSGAEIIVLCSSDEEYATLAPKAAQLLKAQNTQKQLVVAGYPIEIIETLKTSGVDDFIHVKSNIVNSLNDFQKRLGII